MEFPDPHPRPAVPASHPTNRSLRTDPRSLSSACKSPTAVPGVATGTGASVLLATRDPPFPWLYSLIPPAIINTSAKAPARAGARNHDHPARADLARSSRIRAVSRVSKYGEGSGGCHSSEQRHRLAHSRELARAIRTAEQVLVHPRCSLCGARGYIQHQLLDLFALHDSTSSIQILSVVPAMFRMRETIRTSSPTHSASGLPQSACNPSADTYA